MKLHRVFLLGILLLLPFIVLLESGCGDQGSMSPTSLEKPYDTPAGYEESEDMEMMRDAKVDTSSEIESPVERKIIYSGSVTVVVKDYAGAEQGFTKIMDKYKDFTFIHSSNTYVQYEKYKTTHYVVKVHPDKLNEFIEEIKTLGEVTAQSLKGEDITEQYVDLQSRLKNKEHTLARLKVLMDTKTNKLSDLLSVEREIERVSQDIEQLKGKIRYYDNLVGMATLEVNLNEKIPPRVRKFEFGESLKTAISDSFWAGWQVLLFFIRISIPGLIIIGIFWFIIWLLVKIFKRSKSKKQIQES